MYYPVIYGRRSQLEKPEAQADVAAAMLDELDIQKAVVLGVSAGGLSSIRFALRRP